MGDARQPPRSRHQGARPWRPAPPARGVPRRRAAAERARVTRSRRAGGGGARDTPRPASGADPARAGCARGRAAGGAWSCRRRRA
ncbi:MAG: hypothetical protein EOM21_15735 [Gammaproteobacteria bacterium]|nr:hypothetical protein [Gammaproteobacteria bacterium]